MGTKYHFSLLHSQNALQKEIHMLEPSTLTNDPTTASPELNNASPRRSPPPTPPKPTSLQDPEEEKKEVAVSPAQPPSNTVDFNEDCQRFIAFTTDDCKLTSTDYLKLTSKDKALFHDFLNHYDQVKKCLAKNPPSHDTKAESEIKKELHLAASALKKLNVRSGVTAACCAVLAAAAAAAAAVFLWPAAVVA